MWLRIAEKYEELLRGNGLSRFPDFMSFQGGKVHKKLPLRTVRRIELSHKGGSGNFFMKRHAGSLRVGEVIRAGLSGFPLSWGKKEWEVIQAFRRSGIPTLTPVAAGEKISFLKQESFLITEELQGFGSLETYIKTRFQPPLTHERISEKRDVIREVARIAAKMHESGFNHRDFYCCHIFIRNGEDGRRRWSVLDLQRVDYRRWFRKRWIVKDLAALNYSAAAPVITRTDRLRFLKVYMAERFENSRRKRFLITRVVRKTGSIKRHDRKLRIRKEAGDMRDGRLPL